MQTVSSRPRTWSSYSNIRAKDVDEIITMNSTEEISRYTEEPANFYSPTLQRRTLGYSYDFPEKDAKKDKKWSIGSLFRRKKRDDSASSSDEEQKKGFLGRRRRKSDGKRKKPPKPIGTFDHVVIQPGQRTSIAFNGHEPYEDTGILSDPTGGFSNYIGRALPKIPVEIGNKENNNVTNNREAVQDMSHSRLSVGSGSADSLNRKSRRELTKARAVARRTLRGDNSSSDEDSQRSNSSLRIRSEENLKQRDSSATRRSRAARTERYLKRHSRDGENPHNYLRIPRSDADNNSNSWRNSDDSNRSPSRSPISPNANKSYVSSNSQSSSITGLSTIPPSHSQYGKYKISNSTSNPSYKPPLSMNEYNSITKKLNESNNNQFNNNQRSVSCEENINKKSSIDIASEILHVQFPIIRPNNRYRNLSLIDPSLINKARQPPAPPPRDPNRLVTATYGENTRPTTYYLDNSRSRSFNVHSNVDMTIPTKKYNSFNLHTNNRSVSEDYLPNPSPHITSRPLSTTPLATKRNQQQNEQFNYLTDKKPRSRKPIFIQSSENVQNDNPEKHSGTQKALDFWKQRDRENLTNMRKSGIKSRSTSPQMFTAQTHVHNQIFLPSVIQKDSTPAPITSSLRVTSPFKPVSPTLRQNECVHKMNQINSAKPEKVEDDSTGKSTNLEDALDELEAIYNSLRLGDEDLLERAEQRERDAVAQKLSQTNLEPYPNWNPNRGHLSDSSYNYEPFDSIDSPRRKKIAKKNRQFDRKADDMAYRKINKDRSHTISDPQSVTSRISYLMTSPVHGVNPEIEQLQERQGNEPDITRDDVVYRNVKHANQSLKILDPQPPFGIPVGPITPAANSDYLHAVPDNIERPVYKPRKIPDIVKDDLAFRNLRKDSNKEPALPLLSPEDFKNNNSPLDNKIDYFKKRRAVRSLSANIGSLISKEVIEKAKKRNEPKEDVENEFNSLTDIADAMEIARQVLREKDMKISNTRKAFMSDTDTQYLKNKYKRSDQISENRAKFLNGLKDCSNNTGHDLSGSLSKPKLSREVKESTPIPKSPLEKESDSTNSSLDELLQTLAQEAKETSQRINSELMSFNDVKAVENETKKQSDLDQKLAEIDSVSEHAKLCEKLLECSMESPELARVNSPVTEKTASPVMIESVANIVLKKDNEKNKVKEVTPESDHDYENLQSEEDLIPTVVNMGDEAEEKCTSPFEEHKAELVASFQELKDNMKDIELPKPIQEITITSKKRETPKDQDKKESSSKTDSVYDNLSDDNNKIEASVTGEECVDVLEVVALSNSESNASNPNELTFVSNCEITIAPEPRIESHYLSRTETIDSPSGTLDSLESLKSPRLVLESARLAEANLSIDEDKNDRSRDMPGTSSDGRSDDLRESGRGDGGSKACVWYRDPTKMAIACSYGIACAHQMASLDIVAILGLLFAVISFIAAMFL